MKKDILLQRFVHAKITPYKDYCCLKDKTNEEDSTDRLFDWESGVNNETPYLTNRVHFHDREAYNKKNSKIFYGSKGHAEKNLKVSSKLRYEIYTTDDRHIKKHFGKPFSEILIKLNEKSIREDDDKIYVRKYWHTKSRHLNCRYFKKTNGYYGFTFNKKNGNIISYMKQDGLKLSMRQNSFDHLSTVLKEIISVTEYFSVHQSSGSITKKTINEYNEMFSRGKFLNEIYNIFSKTIKGNVETIPEEYLKPEHIGSSLTLYGGIKNEDYSSKILVLIMKSFIEIKGVKTPNTYTEMLTKWYPTKPFLAKNDNKLVLSILDRLGVKSKSLNKLIHSKENFILEQLIVLMPYFGKNELAKYVSNITQNFFLIDWKKIIGENNNSHVVYSYRSVKELKIYDLTSSEKTIVLRYLNDFFNTSFDSNFADGTYKLISRIFRELNDHFDMIEKVREYYPNTEMRATNQLDFHSEHIELSKIQNSIRKGYTIQYTFPEEFVSYVEEPILGYDNKNTEVLLYPVLLKTDSEYSEEGSHMHHCVGSYADKENSVIISLRVDSPSGDERVTVEFNANNKACIQSKYFCNNIPPELFMTPLVGLINRIDQYEKSIKSIKKERIPLVINGIVVGKEKTTEDFFMDLIERQVQQEEAVPDMPF